MKIAIDGYEANVSELVGIGQYAYQMLLSFYKIDQINEYVVFLPSQPLPHLPKPKANWRYVVGQPGILWTILELPKLLKKENCDLVFSPTHYLPRVSKIPKVMAVMDLSYLHYPKMFKLKDLIQLKLMGGYSIKHAQHILTISEFSKSEIVKYYKIPEGKITVTYPGIKSQYTDKLVGKKQTPKELFTKFEVHPPYLLFVGTLQPRKNITSLVSAFENLSGDLQLVIVGKHGWLYEPIIDRISSSPKKNQIKIVEYVADHELQVLYQNAICLVLPSFYEGFGIPVVEAMASGCVVVVSNTSSLPEVAGKAGIYVNPNDVMDIARGMKKAIELTKDERKEVIKLGISQSRKFAFENSAKVALSVFNKVYQKR